ncbi:2-amino-4-hydroxy-6-hydroxymethyldihydropteridine diphosphokinase [Bacillus sp. DJP31]|uniref:2-amino-4-hydroxy-6- hydroxymethyldihydropteridine diphosphokinase n=1 Tax=Bacillus sp. DJP31 TaxID=3409789 RepID=UPI003BB4DE87
MKNRVFIGIGSNIQERVYYLEESIKALVKNERIKILNYSSIYETEPVGFTEQDSFLNMVIEISTSMSPHELLSVIQNIELVLGRNREMKWGPRTLDLDILLYNQENIIAEDLIVPHPRMHERAFVIVPLFEIDQELTVNGRKVKDIYMEQLDRDGVQIWKLRCGEGVYELFEN